jgi:uncharacterized protein (DUF1810 family)
MEDPYALARFEIAQNQDATFASAAAELRAGRKVSHWMWFVFPQVAGLGRSPMARKYAISSLDEARAYLSHPILGPRLVESARILTEVTGRTVQEIFGSTDAMKLQSSMTLFSLAAPDEPVFREVLNQYFEGLEDTATRPRLEST